MISDGLHCFKAVAGEVASHTAIVVGSGRQAVTRPEFRRVNTVLSNLKTAISGAYHAFKFAKYADRYLAEVQYRFNRRFDLKSILARLVRTAVLTRPRPEAMIMRLRLGANQEKLCASPPAPGLAHPVAAYRPRGAVYCLP